MNREWQRGERARKEIAKPRQGTVGANGAGKVTIVGKVHRHRMIGWQRHRALMSLSKRTSDLPNGEVPQLKYRL